METRRAGREGGEGASIEILMVLITDKQDRSGFSCTSGDVCMYVCMYEPCMYIREGDREGERNPAILATLVCIHVWPVTWPPNRQA